MNKELNVSELILESPRYFDFWEITNKSNMLLIVLRKLMDNKEIFLKFTFSGIIAYRYTIEGARLKTLNSITSEMRVLNSQDDSEYLRWFEDENGGWLNDGTLKHISIFCSDCIIDTITNEIPKIEWMLE